MAPEDKPFTDMNPSDDDVQQALHSLRHGESQVDSALNASHPADPSLDGLGGAVSVHHAHPIMRMTKFALYKCGWMAEKYPWETAAALLLTVGCGWVCAYFGCTVLGALILYAIYAEE